MTIDPITLSVIQSGLQQVCDEMDLAFSRAAFSPVIAEANDRSDGIYSADDGALIAQGAGGLPVFVGTMQYSTRVLIERIAAGQTAPPEPDDIYIVNDPYLGGTHLMDVRFARPFYRNGEIWSPGSPTPATGPISADRFPAAFPPPPPLSSRKACACPRSNSSSAASLMKRFTPSSAPTSASPISASAMCARRPPPFRSARTGSTRSLTGTATTPWPGPSPLSAPARASRCAPLSPTSPIRHLPGHRLCGQRRRGQRTLGHCAGDHPHRQRSELRLFRLVRPMHRPDEFRPGHHAQFGLSRHAPHLSRGPNLVRRVRAPDCDRHRGHFP